jgi:hypothetical protein
VSASQRWLPRKSEMTLARLHHLKVAQMICCFLTAFAAEPALGQRLGTGSDTGVSAFNIIMLLLFLALLVGGALFVLKAKGHLTLPSWLPASERRMSLIETLRISPQSGLCLIALDGKEMLIAFAGNQITILETDLNCLQPASERSK